MEGVHSGYTETQTFKVPAAYQNIAVIQLVNRIPPKFNTLFETSSKSFGIEGLSKCIGVWLMCNWRDGF